MLLTFESSKEALSPNDKLKFRAKHVKGADERVEIRTSLFGAETLIIVYKNQKRQSEKWFSYDDHLDIRMSANGKLHFTFEEWTQLQQAVAEAAGILNPAPAGGDEFF